MLPGQVIVGWTQWTKTSELQLEVRPCESVAEAVAVVRPTGKAWGEVITALPIVKTGVSGPPHASAAVADKLTVARALLGSVTANMLPGQVTAGGSLGLTA